MTFVADSDVIDFPTLGGNAVGGKLFFADGTMYRIKTSGNVEYIRDRFGNLTTFIYNTTPPYELVQVKDSEGRSVTISEGATQDTITYSGFGGASRTITINFASLNTLLRQDYSAAGVKTICQLFEKTKEGLSPEEIANSPVSNPLLPATVTLPNSHQYQFRYNAYGELAQVGLPTGGRQEYDWTGDYSPFPDGYSGFEDLALVLRAVAARRSYTEGAGGTATDIAYYAQGSGGSGFVREERFGQNDKDAPRLVGHRYNGTPWASSFLQPGAEPYWDHGKEIETWVNGADVLMRNTAQAWVRTPSLAPVVESVTTTMPREGATALKARKSFTYDNFANVLTETETDWGVDAVGAIARTTTRTFVTDGTYTHSGEADAANYRVHLRRLLESEEVTDVKAGGIRAARTELSYDEVGKVSDCSGIDRHDTNPPTTAVPPAVPEIDGVKYREENPVIRNTTFTKFGNVTRVRKWVVGSTFVETKAEYDVAGNVVRGLDGKNQAVKVTYTSANRCAYPSRAELESDSTYYTTMAWDLASGKMTEHEDLNRVKTSLSYVDSLDRMTARTEASNTTEASTTSVAYNDTARTVTVTQPVDSGLTKETVKSFDGLGRVVEERTRTGGTDVVVQRQYDGLGREWKVSLPGNGSTLQWVTTAYDGLDRVLSKTWDDGSAETYSYRERVLGPSNEELGLATKVTDPASKVRRLFHDGLGRLVAVGEGPASPLPLTGTTKYEYSALDSLTRVDQGGRVRTFIYDGLARLSSATNPESGTIGFTYDENSNVLTKTNGASEVVATTYDALNRPTNKTVGTEQVTWSYDKGRLLSVSGGGTTRSYTYTAGGRMATSTQTVGGTDYGFSYGYFLDGSLKSMTYPSGRQVSYAVDRAGRVTGVTGLLGGAAATYASGVQYGASGAMSRLTLGNNLVERWSYNAARGQVWKIELGTESAAQSVGAWLYGYCAGQAIDGSSCGTNNGNVRHQWILPLGKIQSYQFDDLNRITAMVEKDTLDANPVCSSGGTVACAGWQADQWGNQAETAVAVFDRSPFTPTSAGQFNANNQITVQSAVHDAAGRLTSMGVHQFRWDAEDRLRTVANTSSSTMTGFEYDGEGRRVRKLSCAYAATGWCTAGTAGSTVTSVTVYDGLGRAAAEYGGTPGPGGVQYQGVDHLGSTRVVTNGAGVAGPRRDYLPYGELILAGKNGRTTGLGYEVGEGGQPLGQVFTGKERDAETMSSAMPSGLDYFGARYFSGAQGRFTSPDAPFNDQHSEDPQSWNLYAYGRNNPLAFIDPTGQYVCGSNISRDECANFQKSLDQAQTAANALKDKYGADSKQYTTAQRAIDAYGKAGVDNGVTVDVGNTGKYGASTMVAGAAGAKTADNPTGQKVNVTFGTGVLGDTRPGLVAHEGSHIADGSDWVRSRFSAAMNPALYQTEVNAYQVQSNIGQGLGWWYQTVSFAGSAPYLLNVRGWAPANTSTVINAILKQQYGLLPTDQRRAFHKFVKVTR